MGGFHGGHHSSGGGFHGGSHHSSGGSHHSSSYRGSGRHYYGRGGGGGEEFSPFSLIVPFIVGLVIVIVFFASHGEIIGVEYFVVGGLSCFICIVVWLGYLIHYLSEVKNALVGNPQIDNDPNKVYSITIVETYKNKKVTKAFRIIGYVFLAIATIFLFLFGTASTTATVDSVNMATGPYNEKYEEYTFNYTVGSIVYHGNGEDDLVYKNGTYVYDIEVNDVYPIYYYRVAPQFYSFSKDPQIGWVITFYITGAIFLIIGIVFRRRYLKQIDFVGDLNGDGKINEKDLELYQEKLKKIQEEFVNTDTVIKKCPFCDKTVAQDEGNCPYCGGVLKKD